MLSHAAFWYALGVLSCGLATLVLWPFRSPRVRTGSQWRALGAAALVMVPLVTIFFISDGRDTSESTATDADVAIAAAPPELRDADWGMITHAFLGGPPPATGTNSDAGDATQRAQVSATELEAVVKREPRNAEAWLALARAQRVARAFPEASKAYEAALKIDAKNADAWADYADALASASGRSLMGKPAEAIKRALALQPDHLKALWLAASLDLEQRRYGDALKSWQRLRAALPAGSPDAAVIDANIEEARQLASGAPSASTPQSSGAVASIEGTVELDGKMSKIVSQGMSLFIVAKNVQGGGAPLAVTRVAVGKWPVRFKLDDSLAMLPDQNLSSVASVRVEARISLSGDAASRSGDPIAPAQLVATRGAAPITLRIVQTVP
jgi:cytochrome c-type biogenesis protein CcmH